MASVSTHFALSRARSTHQVRLERLWLSGLVFVLASFFLFGKTAAYFFIGELELIAGLLICFRVQSLVIPLRTSTMVLLVCFMIWGVIRTVPFLAVYGSDAIRDDFLWIYGFFALIVSVVVKEEDISRFFIWFRRFAYWGVPLGFATAMIKRQEAQIGALPRLLWAPTVTIPHVKFGDSGVDVGAVLALILLFPQRPSSPKTNFFKSSIFYFFLIVFVLLCASTERASLLDVLIPLTICITFRPNSVIPRIAAGVVFCIVLGGIIFSSGALQTKDGQGRSFDAAQIEANALSLVTSDSANSNLQANKEFRLNWWNSIVNSTLLGSNWWGGYGFGINLTLLPGAPSQDAESSDLRSPHNGTINILARMGLPGILIWIALLISFSVRLLHAQFLAYKIGARFWANVLLWIFCVWLTCFVDSLSDVYLENPIGGVLFWSLIGFGEASLRLFAVWRRKNVRITPTFSQKDTFALQ